jgi:hypothetical protein
MVNVVYVILAAVLGSEPSVPIMAPPTWLSPRFGVATISGDKIEVRYAESVAVWQPRKRTKTFQIRDGERWKSVSETTAYQVRLYETKPAIETRAAGHYRVFRNGTELDEKTRTELLNQPRRVVFLESRQFGVNWPNEFFLDLLAKDTLVVFLDTLSTPEVRVEPEKTPSVIEAPPVAAAPPVPLPEGRRSPDGRYWREALWLQPDRKVDVDQASDGLVPMPDPDLHVVYVIWSKHPEIIEKGWSGPQLARYGGELAWFGNRTGDGPKGAARIAFNVHGKAATSVPYFLSVIEIKTKPQLVLTENSDKASLWSLDVEKSWSNRGDFKDGPDSEHTVGYIKLAGVPDMQLWLSLSPEPILQTQRDGLRGEKRETIECRLLTISPNKKCRFQYVRQWSGGK